MSKPPPEGPLSHKAQRKLRHHAPDFHVCVIYRDESYVGVRGPGYFFVHPLNERVGEMISTKPRAKYFELQNLSTSDPVPISIAGKLVFTFDPREGDPVPISRFVRLPADILNEALTTAVEEFLLKAIRVPVSGFTFEYVQLARNLAALEAEAKRALNESTTLRSLGIRDVGITLTHVILPQELQSRLTESAQRRYNAEVSRNLEQADLLRSLIIELVEKVSRNGNMEQLFNFTEAVNALRQVEARTRATSLPASMLNTIEGETVKPVERLPEDAPAPAPAPKAKSAAKSKSGRGKKRPPPSYLDPDL